MIVDRKQFLEILESVSPGLTIRDVVEQSSCLIFRGGMVSTFNDEVMCSRPISTKEEGAVMAAPLLKVLRGWPSGRIGVKFTDKELLLANKTRTRTAGIRLEAKIVSPIDMIAKPTKWKALHSEFCNILHLSNQCTTSVGPMDVLACVHITKHCVEACDRFQAIRHTIDTGLNHSSLIHRDAIKYIKAGKMVKVNEAEAWLHFCNDDDLMLSCRRWMGSYRSLDSILEADDSSSVILPNEILDVVNKAQIFASDSKQVLVEMDSGKLKISGENSSGWFKETIELKHTGSAMKFRITPELLCRVAGSECRISRKKIRVDNGSFVWVAALSVL